MLIDFDETMILDETFDESEIPINTSVNIQTADVY